MEGVTWTSRRLTVAALAGGLSGFLIGFLFALAMTAAAQISDPDDFAPDPSFWICAASSNRCTPIPDYVGPDDLRCFAFSRDVSLCVRPDFP